MREILRVLQSAQQVVALPSSTHRDEDVLDNCDEDFSTMMLPIYGSEELRMLEPTPIGPNGTFRDSNGHNYQKSSSFNFLIDGSDEFSSIPTLDDATMNVFMNQWSNVETYNSDNNPNRIDESTRSSCGLGQALAPTILSSKQGRSCKLQTCQWNERLQELLSFQGQHGHLFVPHSYPANQKLAQWVKRQRYQHKLKQDGQHSTLTDEREQILNQAGFVWDSHRAAWHERFQQLQLFCLAHGHSNVSAKGDATLSVWCKHQRRQMKKYVKARSSSTMTPERIDCLNSIGFDWDPRNLRRQKRSEH